MSSVARVGWEISEVVLCTPVLHQLGEAAWGEVEEQGVRPLFFASYLNSRLCCVLAANASGKAAARQAHQDSMHRHNRMSCLLVSASGRVSQLLLLLLVAPLLLLLLLLLPHSFHTTTNTGRPLHVVNNRQFRTQESWL